MKTSLRSLAFSLTFSAATAALLGGCTNAAQTEALVQARLDAEKVKDLTTQAQELKTANSQLQKDNEELRLQLAQQAAKAGAQSRLATRQKAVVSHAGGPDAAPSPKEVEELKNAVQGGGSFK